MIDRLDETYHGFLIHLSFILAMLFDELVSHLL